MTEASPSNQDHSPNQTHDNLSEDSSVLDQSNEDTSEDDETFDSLVAGRGRRQTAGNRLSAVLGQEQPDEDLDLLFAENEEDDVEFDSEDVEQLSDGDEDDSSSSSDDENAQDDLDGEKQLRQEERARQMTRKRQADKAFMKPPAMRKKVRIQGPSKNGGATPSAPRPKKKGPPRLHTQQDGPRKSTRTLAVQNKQKTQASIAESQAKRKRTMATLEAMHRKRNAERPEPLTQAQRMAEAAETERLNGKSLNAYEETEKERIQKQRARLEALQNRVLEGPVIRWHSGRVEWVNGQMIRPGRQPLVEEVRAVEKGAMNEIGSPIKGEKVVISGQPGRSNPSPESEPQTTPANLPQHIGDGEKGPPPIGLQNEQTPAITFSPDRRPGEEISKNLKNKENQQNPTGLLHGIDYYAKLSDDSSQQTPIDQVTTSQHPQIKPPDVSQGDLRTDTRDGVSQASGPGEQDVILPQTVSPSGPVALSVNTRSTATKTEYSARNTLTLLNFAPIVEKAAELKRRIVFNWRDEKSGDPGSHVKKTCAITGGIAKYRDPETGLPYSGLNAYKTIRRLVNGCVTRPAHAGTSLDGASKGKANDDGARPVWSSLLGAWAGRENDAAAGVPESFVRPSIPGISGEVSVARDVKD